MKRKDKDGNSNIKKRPLADTVLESLEPEVRQYAEVDTSEIGLYFVVKPSGAKSWTIRYKTPEGKWSWLGIGPYGAGAHQLNGAQAREKARQLLKQAKDDATPLPLVKNPPAPVLEPQETFGQLTAEWLEVKRKKWTPDTFDRAQGMLDKHIIPAMGQRPYTGIPASEWFNHFKAMEEQGILETLAKARAYCRDIYALAQVTDRAKYNPIDNLHRFIAPSVNENFAHVSQAELSELIRAIRQHTAREVSIGLQLLMLLAVRPGELRAAQWTEFNLDTGLWDVAAIRKKERRDFLLPLPRQAVQLLKELHHINGHYPWLFPGRSKPMEQAISNMTFNQTLDRLGYKGRQTPHGMRHLFSTAANEAGKDWRIVDSALAHKVRGTEGVYNKAQYLAQRRELLQWWADRVDHMASESLAAAKSA